MFKRIFQKATGKVPEPKPESPTSAVKTEDILINSIDISKTDNTEKKEIIPIDIELDIEHGGGKGWPSYAMQVIHHKALGLIIVVTDIGSIYVYGEGFQYFRPSDGSDTLNDIITFVMTLNYNQLLVAHADNSLLILELPTLNIISNLIDSWLLSGDISYISHDETSDKRFLYVGTTDGNLFVLEALPTNIREVDYFINFSDVGLKESHSISNIQIHPKEEKYLAIGYAGDTNEDGAVVIWDIVKRKAKRFYQTSSITSLIWSYTGDLLYAGNKLGVLFCGGVEKEHMLEVWNCKTERSDYDNESENEDNIFIRKMQWLAPQSSSLSESCLFLLLSCQNSENLKSAIVGLSSNNIHGNVDLIFTNPPIYGEAIHDMILLSSVENTYEKDNSADTGPLKGVPSLLIMTKSLSEDSSESEKTQSYLKLVRCPSTALSEWPLEIGINPEPRLTNEVLSRNSKITSIKVVPPNLTVISFTSVLITATHEASQELKSTSTELSGSEVRGRRQSAKEFFKASTRLSAANFEAFQFLEESKWELPLASSVTETGFGNSVQQPHDIVFLGYADGTVVAWNVIQNSKPKGSYQGVANVWLPLREFPCGTTEITVIVVDNDYGLLATGDESGNVTIWEIFDSSTDTGAAKHFSMDIYSRGIFRPDNIRQLFKASTNGDSITSISLIIDSETLVVGTISGKLYISLDWQSNQLSGSNQLTAETIGASGAILNSMLSTYWKTTPATPAVFVLFESGNVGVVNFTMMCFIACCPPPTDWKMCSIAFSEIVDSNFEEVTEADIEEGSRQSPRSDDTNEKEKDAPEKARAPSPKLWDKLKTSLNTQNTNNSTSVVFPSKAPRYLLYIIGKILYTYDISKFSGLGSKLNLSASLSSAERWATSRKLTDGNILSAEKLVFIEEATRAYSEPIVCIASLDSDGSFYLHSFKDKSAITNSPMFLGVCSSESPLLRGSVLKNGSCYAQQNENMIHVASIFSTKHILSVCPPSTSMITLSPPNSSLQLIDSKDLKQFQTTTKRRMSIMPMVSVNLNQFFSKTRDQREKEELFKSTSTDDDSIGNSSQSAANKALQAAAEAREALQERGRKLQQLNKKTDAMASSSEDFRNQVKKEKEKLQEKNNRWGIF